MTRNREVPDRWPASNTSKPGQINGWQRRKSAPPSKPPLMRPATGVPNAPNLATPTDNVSHTVSRPPHPSPTGVPNPQGLDTPGAPSPPPSKRRQERKRLLPRTLQFWAILILLFSGGVGFMAVALLLKLPAVPNCPATFWPTASASMRLYCAQLAANKQTAENLLEAIALVEGLPADHPLRPTIDGHIEQWSLDILKIGEQKFQAGQINEAIKIAKRIPSNVSAHNLVEKQIGRWQGIWSKGQDVYNKAVAQLKESNWNQAFREAVKLTSIDNKYWATVQYERLVDLIQIGREASAQLDKAYQLSKSGSVDSILSAIKEAEKIPRESFAYKEAQDLIADCGNKLIKIAEERLDRRNWKGVLEIANKLPPSVKLPQLKADLIDLADALSNAESGTALGLEDAIASAQKLGADRPLYDKAQEFIGRWQREKEDVARLERARTFAKSGLSADIRTAIAEAQQIPVGNPRYQEARTQIRRWASEAETIEDQPYLDRAKQIASFGGVPSFQEAIQEASHIAPGRALYKEAQSKIGEWTRSIQRIEDQPFLDQARALADGGNLPAAISAAQQIRAGRSLYDEAQGSIRSWQAEIEGQQRLQAAYQASTPGTAEALREAIRLARQVPRGASNRSEARSAADRWSSQLLSIATDRSSYDLNEAIEIAKMIPSGTEAFDAAQQQIQSWQRILEPPPSPSPVGESTGTDAGLF
jgi:soluble cytochrome b562